MSTYAICKEEKQNIDSLNKDYQKEEIRNETPKNDSIINYINESCKNIKEKNKKEIPKNDS